MGFLRWSRWKRGDAEMLVGSLAGWIERWAIEFRKKALVCALKLAL